MFDFFSVQVISFILVAVAIFSLFNYIPIVSDFAFWFVVAGYALLAVYRPPPKK